MSEKYDVVIVGSGLGGLVSAIILAKEGYSVCVLEKNNQFGGNLQTFVRNKTIFDTGVHYIGGLSEGQNLYRYFQYLGILSDISLQKLDENGFDVLSFGDDEKEYRHAQGYENFIKVLLKDFPQEESAIREYCQKLQEICKSFPLYELREGKPYSNNDELFGLNAKQFINSLTKDQKLRAVLGGSNLLYAGEDRTPFYVHALSINSYIESAYRCVNGGSQITKALLNQLRNYGGKVYKRHEVVHFEVENNSVAAVQMANGKAIKGDIFISNVDPKVTLRLVGEQHFKKAYTRRVKQIESTIASFNLYLVLKPNCFKYRNHNYYHFKDSDAIWNAQDYSQESWPETYMASMGMKRDMGVWADNLTIMTYMRFEEVAPWADTFNTAAQKNERGQTYEEFKEAKTETLLVEIEKRFPNIRNCIEAVYSSTPLSYRDYIGSNDGSMYGYVKDANYPMHSFISPRTKIDNLYFTGQSLNMHGILGVTISGIVTCSEILGSNYLLSKILEANKTENIS